MAIVVSTPTHIGPGYLCFVAGLTGPVPLDDEFDIGVRESGGANFLTGGSVILNGSTSAEIIIGLAGGLPIADGLDRYIAPGSTVQAEWTQRHSDFTTVASGTVTGLLWDPTGGAYQLAQLLLASGGGSSATLDAILAAVRKAY